MKPRRPHNENLGRNLLGAPLLRWPVAQLAEHSAVTGAAAGSTPAWPATFLMHTHSSAGRAPLLQSGGPWFDSKCVYHSCDVSSVGTERRFAMPEVEGSTPSRRATHRSSMNHAALAQRIRVPGFDPGGRGFKSCTPRQLGRSPIAIAAVLRRVPIEA